MKFCGEEGFDYARGDAEDENVLGACHNSVINTFAVELCECHKGFAECLFGTNCSSKEFISDFSDGFAINNREDGSGYE